MQLAYIVTCNEQSYAIRSSAITLCWYLGFLSKLRKQSQNNMLITQNVFLSQAEMHQNHYIVFVNLSAGVKTMFKWNGFHGLLGIPTSFSPKENLAISFPEITEGCIQPTIQTVHLTLHSIIYFPSPLNFFQAPDNRIQALHCVPCRDRSCQRKKKNPKLSEQLQSSKLSYFE